MTFYTVRAGDGRNILNPCRWWGCRFNFPRIGHVLQLKLQCPVAQRMPVLALCGAWAGQPSASPSLVSIHPPPCPAASTSASVSTSESHHPRLLGRRQPVPNRNRRRLVAAFQQPPFSSLSRLVADARRLVADSPSLSSCQPVRQKTWFESTLNFAQHGGGAVAGDRTWGSKPGGGAVHPGHRGFTGAW